MVLHKRIPFLSARELQAIFDSARRTGDGCLIYRGPSPQAPHSVLIRGQLYVVTRVVWAETYGWSGAALERLARLEVIHVAECPHAGRTHRAPCDICIEPTHLTLGTITERISNQLKRKEAYE